MQLDGGAVMDQRRYEAWRFSGEQEGRGTRCTLVDNTVPLTLHPGANLGGGDQIRWNSIARVSENFLRTGVPPGVQF